MPYAFDRPLVTMTRSLMPQKLFVRGREISAPRYTSSDSSHVPVASHRATVRVMASSESTDPVGLFGFERYSSRVSFVTAASHSCQSGCHSLSCRRLKGRTLAPP